MRLLLDTNVVSELRKKDRGHPAFVRWAAGVDLADCYLSVLVMGELRRGVELMRRNDPPQAAVLERWFSQVRSAFGPRILRVDERIAETWAHLNVPTRRPAVDSLLAATAMVNDLVLVTRNTRDFPRSGLSLVNPFQA